MKKITKKKKILIVCDSSKSLLDFRGKLIEKLQEKNQVYVFTPIIKDTAIRNQLNKMNVIVKESNLDGSNVSVFSDLQFIISLRKQIRQIRPDIFFPYTLKPVIYGTILAKNSGVNCIVPMITGLGYNFTKGNRTNKLVANFTKLLLKISLKSDPRLSLVLQNRDDAQDLLDLKIINATQNVHVVNGSGVDLTHYAYAEPNINSVTFLMIARLINAKGVKEYFEAATKIKSKYPNVKFQLVGDYDRNIDSISEELYCQIIKGDIIEYVGFVNDVRPLINKASVVVLPSYYREGVPRALLESMAMGRAVITCDSPGCRETVNSDPNKSNGFLIPIKDSYALASKMEYFILNREEIIDYGKKSLVFAKEKFDVNLINKDMMKIMELDY